MSIKKNQNNDALRQFSDLGESFMILHRFLLNKLKFSKDVKYPPKHLGIDVDIKPVCLFLKIKTKGMCTMYSNYYLCVHVFFVIYVKLYQSLKSKISKLSYNCNSLV